MPGGKIRKTTKINKLKYKTSSDDFVEISVFSRYRYLVLKFVFYSSLFYLK